MSKYKTILGVGIGIANSWMDRMICSALVVYSKYTVTYDETIER